MAHADCRFHPGEWASQYCHCHHHGKLFEAVLEVLSKWQLNNQPPDFPAVAWLLQQATHADG